MSKKFLGFLPLIIFLSLILWVSYFVWDNQTPSAVDTPAPTPAVESSTTLVAVNSPASISTPTVSPTSTATPTAPPTNTPPSTPTPTFTPMPTHTATPIPTATLSPTQTPTPTPEAVVVANELNLRAGPGTVYHTVGVLHQGDTLDIQGRIAGNEWIQVVSGNLEALGWVSGASNLIQINADLNTIPVAAIPPTPIPLVTSTPTSSIKYSAPTLTNPDNGVGTFGAFPPLFWTWDGELGENEFFEVRVWHESITTYHPALGWVKVPQFDYNVSGERDGKYYWTVAIVQGANPKPKDWTLQPMWPYPMWEGTLIGELSPESETRFFFFTPDRSSGGGGSPISSPPDSGIEN